MRVLPKMMSQRATASRALGNDNLAAMASQEPDRRLIDLRRENLLRAPVEERRRDARVVLCF